VFWPVDIHGLMCFVVGPVEVGSGFKVGGGLCECIRFHGMFYPSFVLNLISVFFKYFVVDPICVLLWPIGVFCHLER
jgi:hypothetical protein